MMGCLAGCLPAVVVGHALPLGPGLGLAARESVPRTVAVSVPTHFFIRLRWGAATAEQKDGKSRREGGRGRGERTYLGYETLVDAML